MSFEEILVDGRPAPLLRSVKAIAVPYADNLNIVGVSREHVQDLKDKAVARLREVGFRVHEEEDAQPHAKALGFILDGQRGRVHPIPEKRDRVIATLRWLSGRPRVSGRVLERVIGHCIHFFMLRRELLSIFRSVYDFKTAHYTTQKRLWRSAADECRWAANLLVICEADLKKPWSSTLTASDACLSGTATCSLELEPSEIRIMGSCRELWRFRSNDPSCKARDSVLALDPFKDVETVLPWHVLEDPFRINQQFPNVRKDVATSPEWKLQFSARMTKAEHITILEGRASLQSFRHKLRSVNHFGKRHLHLGDNLGMVLAFDRGRAKAIPLLFCCRRAAALSFASNSVFCHRWIPSEWNPADGPSRRWEKTRKVEVSARKKAKEVSKKIYPSKGQVDQCYIPSADIDPRFETSCSVGDQIIKSTEYERNSISSTGQKCRGEECKEGQPGPQSPSTSKVQWTDSVGGDGSFPKNFERLPKKSFGIPRLLQDTSVRDHNILSNRPCLDLVPQPGFIFRRDGHLRGGQIFCFSHGSKPCGRANGTGEKQAGSQRMEKPRSGQQPLASSLAIHQPNGNNVDAVRSSTCRPLHSHNVLNLHSSQRSSEDKVSRPGSISAVGGLVGDQSQPTRVHGAVKGGALGRGYPTGFTRDGFLGARLGETKDGCGSNRPPIPHGLSHPARQLEEGFDQSQPSSGLCSVVPDSTQRCFVGCSEKISQPVGDQVEGQVGSRQQFEEIRESCSSCPALRTTLPTDQEEGRGISKVVEGHGLRIYVPMKPNSKKPILECYAGCAAFSKALARQGFTVHAIDIQ